VSVLGVAMGVESAATATLRLDDTQEVKNVRKGDAINGWTLAEVRKRAVVLKRNEETMTVEMAPPGTTAAAPSVFNGGARPRGPGSLFPQSPQPNGPMPMPGVPLTPSSGPVPAPGPPPGARPQGAQGPGEFAVNPALFAQPPRPASLGPTPLPPGMDTMKR
jgi:hypothetical protein